MSAAEILLTAGMRSSLFSLKGIAGKVSRTQERLATGRRVNSALDNPTNFFASQAHLNRAADFLERKDAINEAVQNLKAADIGIGSILSLLDTAAAIANAASGTSEPSERAGYAATFKEIASQIDMLASDSGYRGTNLLIGQTLTVDVSITAGASTLAIAGNNSTSSGLGVSITAAPTPDWTLSGTIDGSGPYGVGIPFQTTETFTLAQASDIVGRYDKFRYVSATATATVGGWSSSNMVDFSLIGEVKSGFFASGDAITVEFYSGGVDQTTGEPIATAGAWSSTAGIKKSLVEFETATGTMRSLSGQLSSNSAILTTRLDFIANMSDVLQIGSDTLTLADMNEEAANMLMLQTSQNLAITSLGMGVNDLQSLMRLF